MPEILEHAYPTVDMTEVGKIIRKLHDRVAQQGHRIHITRDGCQDICVMISQKELESLENAIAMLADTEQFNEMCENLRNLLNNAGMVYARRALGESGGEGAFAD